MVLFLRISLTFLVTAHLALVALLPSGKNALFGLEARSALGYLTLAPVGDAMGFFKTNGQDGFLVYKIYTEDGSMVEGAFPAPKTSPRMRFDRWAMMAHYISQDHPRLHELFMTYLAHRLPAPPLRVELLSARWDWSKKALGTSGKESGDGVILVLKKLGTYDGLNRKWTPVGEKKSRRNKK